jgi:hypothetical protein
MLGGKDLQARILTARELGAVYYRPSKAIFVGAWKGRDEECEAAMKAGLKLVLTVRNTSGPGTPSSPPADVEAYRKTLGEILDRCTPALLVVENEENSAALFYEGSADEYLAQLKVACEVAHSKGVKCTNGGLVSSLVAALVADDYRQKGDAAKAQAYLKRALSDEKLEKLARTAKFAEQVAKGAKLLEGYRAAGADYVNFHWYISDAEAPKEAVAFLKEKTGLPVLSNEIGQQKNESPEQVTRIMQTVVELKLPIAVWFSMDIDAFGEARGLVNEDGSLRPNGEAFKRFVQEKFGKTE